MIDLLRATILKDYFLGVITGRNFEKSFQNENDLLIIKFCLYSKKSVLPCDALLNARILNLVLASNPGDVIYIKKFSVSGS